MLLSCQMSRPSFLQLLVRWEVWLYHYTFLFFSCLQNMSSIILKIRSCLLSHKVTRRDILLGSLKKQGRESDRLKHSSCGFTLTSFSFTAWGRDRYIVPGAPSGSGFPFRPSFTLGWAYYGQRPLRGQQRSLSLSLGRAKNLAETFLLCKLA